MSDLPNHDHDPDPAALDELQRAFADDSDDREADDDVSRAEGDTDVVSAVGSRAEGDTDVVPSPPEIVTLEETSDGGAATQGDDPPPDDHGRPVDLVIVEQEAAESADDDADESSPPIIRIDDYSGSTAIDDRTPESLAETPDGTDAPDTATAGEPVAIGDDDGGVITISDDDLPDPVYVEGSLDADGSGTIVFIEDDDTGDVLGPESERDLRRGIEPRMRERRVAVKRAQGRRRLKRVAIVLGVLGVIVGILAVLGSPLFAVREGDVEVFGARYTDEERLQEIVDDAVGTPVLRLDSDRVEADIEEIPWVDEASVSTDFPHGLVIDIREREAWTTYQGPDGRYRVLDREGRVLDVLDKYPFAYVLIIGPDPVDLEAGDFAPQGYVAASELAKNLTGAMRGRVTQIEVTADGSRLAVHLDDGSIVLFGEARDLLAKLVRLEAVLTNGQDCESGRIDVSTADVTRCSVLE